MWAGSPYADAPWASPVIPSSITVGTIPPPIPGGSGQPFTWAAPAPVRPWAAGGWAGGIAPMPFNGGGIQAHPDPDSGVVNVQAWWPNIPSLELMRVTPDGVSTPVRGAFPLLNGPTRTNYCTNPSGQVGNNGYFPRVGSPTFSTGIRSDTNGPCILVNVAANGEVSFDIPESLPDFTVYTIGFDLLLPRRPGVGKLTMNFTDNSGASTTPAVVTLDANSLNAAINQWSRIIVSVQAPANATAQTTVNLDFTSMVAGDQIGISNVTCEKGLADVLASSLFHPHIVVVNRPTPPETGNTETGNTNPPGPAGDGNSMGGFWTGTPGLSVSRICQVMSVVDGEAPLDVPVSYQVWNTSITGGVAQSIPVTLASNGQSWLTHSGDPARPLAVSPTVVPTLKRAAPQTTLTIIGRPRPVVITSGVRQAPSGTIILDSPDFTYRGQLLGLLADQTPLLFRAPAEYGYGYGQWLAFGDMDEDPQGRPAYLTTRMLTLPFQEVDPPVNSNLSVA